MLNSTQSCSPSTPSSYTPIAPASAKQIAHANAISAAALNVRGENDAAIPTIDEIFLADGKVDMRLLMISLWNNRKNVCFTSELCERLSQLSISNATLDQVEFYLPQLAHMVVHFDKELPIEDMEQFVLLLSQSSVHFALQFFWIVYAALDENRPKRNGNPKTFARCARLLLALEQCLVYGSPAAREASELLTRHSINKAEMEQLLRADRRFFAAQSSIESSQDTAHGCVTLEGWLYKKGGGTSKMGRRNWKLRWCRIEKRMLLVFTKPSDVNARTAVPLDRAEIRVAENPKHPHYFELIHEFSETKMKFAAPSAEELATWSYHLHRAASAPDPPSATTPTKLYPERTIARMSVAMRSFILHSSSSPDGKLGTETPHNGSPTKVNAPNINVSSASPPPSPTKTRSTVPSSSSFNKNDLPIRRVRSMSSADRSSSEAIITSATTAEISQPMSYSVLPYDQQRRYEFFTGMINFIKSITDVSEALRHVEPAKRKSLLQPRLERLKVPPNSYIPLCKSTDPYCRVLAVFKSEGRVFSTNERAPCLLYFDTEEDSRKLDVSHSLFEDLYADEKSISEGSSTEQEVQSALEAEVQGREINDVSPFLQRLLLSTERRQRLEKIFGELSFVATDRLRPHSRCTDDRHWRMCTVIAKSHDDLRQEVLVMQLISYFHHIFQLENLPLRLHPYRILSTGSSTGLIEVVRNAMSLDGIKKTLGFKNLRHHFEHLYGGVVTDEDAGTGDELLRKAELNFIHSLAAYSIVCYILSIKDRHNGNILLDVEGHIVHIDFGFFLGRAPGGSFSFETAPFKLTTEMVDVLGGRQSMNFKYFTDLCVKGAIAARKHAETIFTLVEVMSFHSKLPCFAVSATAPLVGLRERLFLNISEDKVESTIVSMIERAYDHFGTTKYDQFQVYSNGIAK